MLLFDSLQVPSEQWTKHRFPGHDGVVYCTSVLTSRNEVCSEKVVMFFQSQTHSYYKVFVRGILLKESTMQTSGEAEDVLRATDSMSVCTGVMRLEDYEERYFTKNLKSHVVTLEQMYFSSNCLGQVAERGTQCVSCRYLKRALQIRRARVKRTDKKSGRSVVLKLRAAARRNKRLVVRLGDVKNELAKMRGKNAAIQAEALEAQISKLPPRQQEAVRQCFAASKVKPNGLRYTKMWVLDCIIMKMKSPRLYEHLRRNSILSLPCKSTLKRYVSAYRTVFGFSDKVLRQLKVKSAELDAWKKHGRLVIDELKLSEHFAVKTENGAR
nr:uncharacterized protein LOC126516502 [Dermacentor andersoni]